MIPWRLSQYFNCLPCVTFDIFNVYKEWWTSYEGLWSILPIWVHASCVCWRKTTLFTGMSEPRRLSILLRNPWHQVPCLVHQTISVTFLFMWSYLKRQLVWYWFRRMRSSLSMSYIIELKPYRCKTSLFPCGEASLGYRSCGSAFETLHSPSPNLGHSSYQSISVCPD